MHFSFKHLKILFFSSKFQIFHQLNRIWSNACRLLARTGIVKKIEVPEHHVRSVVGGSLKFYILMPCVQAWADKFICQFLAQNKWSCIFHLGVVWYWLWHPGTSLRQRVTFLKLRYAEPKQKSWENLKRWRE